MKTIKDSYQLNSEVELLPGLRINPFVRRRWFEPGAEEQWSEKLTRAMLTHQKLEIETVVAGIRQCTTRNVRPEDLSEFTARLAARDLYFQPIRKIGARTGTAGFHVPVDSGKGWKYYGVVSSSLQGIEEFVEASADPDASPTDPTARENHWKVGELLGYPECCLDFYKEVFQEKHYYDAIWQIACNTDENYAREVTEGSIVLEDISWKLNILLHCMQIKICPHFPCSFGCGESIEFADSWLELGREKNMEGIADLEDILNLSMQWSSAKGVAEIRTPFFEYQTNSHSVYPRTTVKINNRFAIRGQK